MFIEDARLRAPAIAGRLAATYFKVMPSDSRFRRSRAARARREAPDRLGAGMLVVTVVLGTALVVGLAFLFQGFL